MSHPSVTGESFSWYSCRLFVKDLSSCSQYRVFSDMVFSSVIPCADHKCEPS